MMNWVSLILQLVTLRKGLQESHSMVESARNFAEKGKRTLTAFLAHALASLFFFSGLLVAVIDLGLQIDKGTGVGYSGLMISATILIAIGLVFVGVGVLLGRDPSNAPPPPPPANARADRIKDLLEEFLVTFLGNLSKPKPTHQEPPRQD